MVYSLQTRSRSPSSKTTKTTDYFSDSEDVHIGTDDNNNNNNNFYRAESPTYENGYMFRKRSSGLGVVNNSLSLTIGNTKNGSLQIPNVIIKPVPRKISHSNENNSNKNNYYNYKYNNTGDDDDNNNNNNNNIESGDVKQFTNLTTKFVHGNNIDQFTSLTSPSTKSPIHPSSLLPGGSNKRFTSLTTLNNSIQQPVFSCLTSPISQTPIHPSASLPGRPGKRGRNRIHSVDDILKSPKRKTRSKSKQNKIKNFNNIKVKSEINDSPDSKAFKKSNRSRRNSPKEVDLGKKSFTSTLYWT